MTSTAAGRVARRAAVKLEVTVSRLTATTTAT